MKVYIGLSQWGSGSRKCRPEPGAAVALGGRKRRRRRGVEMRQMAVVVCGSRGVDDVIEEGVALELIRSRMDRIKLILEGDLDPLLEEEDG